MGRITYSETGTVVRWPRDAVGPVVVVATIPFGQGAVRCELIVRRARLRKLVGGCATPRPWQRQGVNADDLLWQEARHLAGFLADWSDAARQSPSVPFWHTVPVRGRRGLPRSVVRTLHNPKSAYILQTRGRMHAVLDIQREDLLRLSDVLARPDGFDRLRLAVRIWLLPNELLGWAERLPRGRSLLTWPLRCRLPLAFWLADILVHAAEKDPVIRQKILHSINADSAGEHWNDEDLTGSRGQLKLLLVERTFRGAWERYGLVRPYDTSRDNSLSGDFEPFRSYLYGAPSEKLRRAFAALQSDPQREANLVWFAERMLLGLPGALARDYGLDVQPAAR